MRFSLIPKVDIPIEESLQTNICTSGTVQSYKETCRTLLQ